MWNITIRHHESALLDTSPYWPLAEKDDRSFSVGSFQRLLFTEICLSSPLAVHRPLPAPLPQEQPCRGSSARSMMEVFPLFVFSRMSRARPVLLDAAQIRSFIASDPILSSLIDRLTSRLNDGDDAHGLSHLMRVARWTLALAPSATAPRTAIAAALLHDLVNVPKHDPRRPLASAESADIADRWLTELGMLPEERHLIYDAILNHSASRGALPSSAFGRALQEADRLDTLGVTSLLRAALTSGRMGKDLACPDDPWATKREPNPAAYALDYLVCSVIPRVATLQHPLARAEAVSRLATLQDALESLGDEWGVPMPLSIRQRVSDLQHKLSAHPPVAEPEALRSTGVEDASLSRHR